MNLTFSGKTVMVTGAGGGSGKAIAKAFLDAGARVVAADLTCPDWKSPSDFIYPAAMDLSLIHILAPMSTPRVGWFATIS